MDGLDGRRGGCTAVVGDVGGTVALIRGPTGVEVRHTSIVADHCVAGRCGLLVEVVGVVDAIVVVLDVDVVGRCSGR